MESQTDTLIIGASLSGLATAASLKRLGLPFQLIEKTAAVATPWRNHYERLHLHTPRQMSELPFMKLPPGTAPYPSRADLITYVENYVTTFDLAPQFDTEAMSVRKDGCCWLTQTNRGIIRSKNVVIATGFCAKRKTFQVAELQSFPGEILHSADYHTGRPFTGQKVLVIGFGNSACEIALDLLENGAVPSMSIRSSVNIIPRDVLGVPILRISQAMQYLPVKLADAIAAITSSLTIGNLRSRGIQKPSSGIFQDIADHGTLPVIDIGCARAIRKGRIEIFDEITRVTGPLVSFKSGRSASFDAIVAAVGYTTGLNKFLDMSAEAIQELKQPLKKQANFGLDRLYFCGFVISPTGHIREIAKDAQYIAQHIARHS